MRFGIHLTHYRPPDAPEPAVDLAQQAESLGFSSVWAGDHIVDPVRVEVRYPHSPPGQVRTTQRIGGMADPFILLAVIAGRTTTITLGFDIIVVPYRAPLPVAKQIATLDALSGGRVVAGVGVGWHEQEFEALGQNFKERGGRTDEAVEIWRKVWTGENVGHTGRYTSFEPLRMLPRPVQPGGPKIYIGGDGAKTRARVSRYGDGWIPTFFSAERYKREMDEIRANAIAAGRPAPVAALQRPIQIVDYRYEPTAADLENPYRPLIGNPDQIIEAIRAYQAAGVEELVFRTGEDPREVGILMDRFVGEVRPAFEE